MRIVLWRYKVLSYLALSLVSYLINRELTDRAGLPDLAAWLSFAVGTALFVTGIRIFRVPEEDIVAPRPWWRAAGRVESGYAMAVLQTVGFAVLVGQLRPASGGLSITPYGGWALAVVRLLVQLVFIAWFIVSSVRLGRLRATSAARA
jgi:hypothetical protein